MDARLQVREVRDRDEQLAAGSSTRYSSASARGCSSNVRCSSTSRHSARSNVPSGYGSAVSDPVRTRVRGVVGDRRLRSRGGRRTPRRARLRRSRHRARACRRRQRVEPAPDRFELCDIGGVVVPVGVGRPVVVAARGVFAATHDRRAGAHDCADSNARMDASRYEALGRCRETSRPLPPLSARATRRAVIGTGRAVRLAWSTGRPDARIGGGGCGSPGHPGAAYGFGCPGGGAGSMPGRGRCMARLLAGLRRDWPGPAALCGPMPGGIDLRRLDRIVVVGDRHRHRLAAAAAAAELAGGAALATAAGAAADRQDHDAVERRRAGEAAPAAARRCSRWPSAARDRAPRARAVDQLQRDRRTVSFSPLTIVVWPTRAHSSESAAAARPAR